MHASLVQTHNVMVIMLHLSAGKLGYSLTTELNLDFLSLTCLQSCLYIFTECFASFLSEIMSSDTEDPQKRAVLRAA